MFGRRKSGMLDAFIIEEIKRREKAREERSRPQPQLPVPYEEDERPRRRSEDESPTRPVIVVDLMPADRCLAA
jgi:hypothetical protein